MRLAPHERQQIERLAAALGSSMKGAIMEAVARMLETERLPVKLSGRLQGREDLVGSFEGPTDLSTDPRYLEGYGK